MEESLSSIYKKYGLSGLITAIEKRSERKFFLRILLNFDKKYFVIFRFLKDLSALERGIKKYGSQKQASKFLKKLKVNTFIYTDIDNKNFHTQKGILIYGINHNAFIEPIIVFSLLKQKNIKLILFRLFFHLGKNIKKFSLPVLPKKFSLDKKKAWLTLDFLGKFRNFEGLREEEIVRMNQKSLKNAIRTLERGGIVVIFPVGGKKFSSWGTGLSKIILGISKEKQDKISLLPVYFQGLGPERMLLRIFKAYRNISQANLRVGVYFGKEKTIFELFKVLGPKLNEEKILNYLRKEAFSQYGLKEFPLRLYLYPRNFPLALSRGFLFLTKLFVQMLPFKELFRG